MSFARVGIIGAGQLGRMLALAAYPLDIACRFVDREAGSPGGQVAPIDTAALDDTAALVRLARAVDVVTCEIENVSVAALGELTGIVPVYPPPAFIALAQDRLAEKRLFDSLGIPAAPYVAIAESGDLADCGERLGWPVVLKARRLGYDGRGQRFARDAAELERGWHELGRVPAIAEGFVAFEREASLIAARDRDGRAEFYPLTENLHRDGILVRSVAPFERPALQAEAEGWLAALMERYAYVGVLAVEFFVTDAGLIANEIAPRVHNSGHWTIEGAETSQFENHMRAVTGLPVGSAAPRGHAAMLNLIGELPPHAAVLGTPGVHLHSYGKAARPQRKVGHCTLVDATRERLLDRLGRFEDALGLAK
jgi:5-(carboxyamino)imidazole ribonucleotide synthase